MEEIREGLPTIVLGVDTHLDVHVGVVVDQLGRVRGTRSIPVTSEGYSDLLSWARGMGNLARVGLEGTGTYGAGLARFLSDQGVQVIEVNRPDRARRRRRGKNDPTDAESAARAVLAGDAVATPKARSGLVEAMRAVSVARRSAVKAKTQRSQPAARTSRQRAGDAAPDAAEDEDRRLRRGLLERARSTATAPLSRP